ncbi:UDP-N-acetylglucosamine--dolichyl-phosphatN-acetylglucosaminephosphotransferase [Malassezia vespertilionis]|uniref:UDP-N-acetylglucosamine--dolichyl-phosphate N-acetylglucosaminephosphotransferase n=1 Tax=Malassezia vespertilionis TaxID=2020962 RepID=A0A2N1J760_9BASI|nr:UDP-N-acetylglucosamine--dolichyl-phosphatN-acetylglucosaminephosphotransferase [Malassezia vespertilionis]PKI82393.1 Alg7p [Malassezia vespertilionis]WFD08000.1 UDP-N-acetylglucosamine--dolichyl-phosphatN-acetylglucosaminephosphotransferase [Malassezia vespertilionis]
MSWAYAALLVPCAAYMLALLAPSAADLLCAHASMACAAWGDAFLRRAAPVASVHAAIQYMDRALPALGVSLVLAVLGYGATYLAIAWSHRAFAAHGLCGRDLLKRTGAPVPESLGLPCAVIYLVLLLLFIPFRHFGCAASLYADHAQNLALYLSALLSMYSGALLGFVDDVLDIRWRFKLPIPLLSSIPMLMVYIAEGGATSVVVPAWPPVLRAFLRRTTLELGALYYVYMMLLAIFCTNCINILAGINGVEVGQALVIAVSVCINDLLYLDVPAVVQQAFFGRDVQVSLPLHNSVDLAARHLFSLHLLLPFIGTSAALLAWNRYPSRVFVGDTYCYFAGMVLVACGVLGHYSKTLLLFFLPQIANFLLSAPQLFHLVPCPRHRIPYLDAATGRLYPSCVVWEPRGMRGMLGGACIDMFVRMRLVCRVYDTHGKVLGVSNLTLLNAILVFCGARPGLASEATKRDDVALRVDALQGTVWLSERGLWYAMMGVQVAGSVLAFLVRYRLANAIFP